MPFDMMTAWNVFTCTYIWNCKIWNCAKMVGPNLIVYYKEKIILSLEVERKAEIYCTVYASFLHTHMHSPTDSKGLVSLARECLYEGHRGGQPPRWSPTSN